MTTVEVAKIAFVVWMGLTALAVVSIAIAWKLARRAERRKQR